jgi:tape measure domain-containing protein
MAEERIRIVIDALNLAKRELETLKKQIGDVDTTTKKTQGSFGMLKKAFVALGVAVLVKQFASFVKESTLLAARVETLGVVTKTLGQNAGWSEEEIRDMESAIQSLGITTQASRQSLALMMQAQIDLSKATDLARMAQDAAVVAGLNSSQAFERLVQVVSSGNVRMARTMGVMVNFNDAYQQAAEAIGKTSQELTENEKVNIRANAVLAKGAMIAGAYEDAMETVGKQLSSTPRYIEEFSVALGEKFTPALGVANLVLQDFLKTGTLLLKWGDSIDKALADHRKEVYTTATSYGAFEKEMLRSLVVAKKLSQSEADRLLKRSQLKDSLVELKAKYGELTEAKMQELILAGKLTTLQAGNILNLVEESQEIERTAEMWGFYSEEVWRAIRAVNLLPFEEANPEIAKHIAHVEGLTGAVKSYGERTAEALPPVVSFLDQVDRDIDSPITDLIKDIQWLILEGGTIEKAFSALRELALMPQTDIQLGNIEQHLESLAILTIDLKEEAGMISFEEAASQIRDDFNVSLEDAKAVLTGTDSIEDVLARIAEKEHQINILYALRTQGQAPPGASMTDIDFNQLLIESGKLGGELQAKGGDLAAGKLADASIIGDQGYEAVVKKGSGFVVIPHEATKWMLKAGMIDVGQMFGLGGAKDVETYTPPISFGGGVSGIDFKGAKSPSTRATNASGTASAEAISQTAGEIVALAENAVSATIKASQASVVATVQAMTEIKNQMAVTANQQMRIQEQGNALLAQLAKASDLESALEAAVDRASV